MINGMESGFRQGLLKRLAAMEPFYSPGHCHRRIAGFGIPWLIRDRKQRKEDDLRL